MDFGNNFDLTGDNGVSFGIDVGTTNSYVSYCEHGKPKVPGVILDGIPSLAWRDKQGNEWYCDEVAKKNGLLEDPKNVWTSGKMKLAEKQIVLNGYSYTPRYLMEKIVSRIVEVGARAVFDEAFLEMKPKTLVAGIPIRFSAAEKAEMQDIIRKSSKAKVILVHEPVLAAIYNELVIKMRGGSAPGKDRKVLVIDLGGGTSDIVVLISNPNPDYNNPEPYIPHHPAGVKKAGDYIDEITEELILEKIRQKPGSIRLDILENTAHHDRRNLRSVAKAIKEKLSFVEDCVEEISGLECGKTTIKVTRSELEKRIRPVIKEFIDIAESVYKKSGFDEYSDVDFLLVGGTSNIPLVKQMLKERFPFVKEDKIYLRNPATAVALGASIYAQNPNIVSSKVAFGYGVNTHLFGSDKEVLRVMIPSVTRLPFTVSSDFATRCEGQTTALFRVYEVYDTDENAVHIELNKGKMTTYYITHHFNRSVPKNTSIRLTLTLTEDGVLNAMVEDFLPDKHIYRETFMLNGTTSC